MDKRTPTTRTIEWIEQNGYAADVVERRVTRAVSRDYLGIADVIGVRPGETVAVQATSSSNVAARISKVRESVYLDAMRAAGWRVLVVGWRRDKDDPRVEEVA